MNSLLPALQALLPFITVPDGKIGPLPVHPFGLLVATGVIVGHQIAIRRAKVIGLDVPKFENLVFATVLTGFILSHMFDVVTYHPDVLRENPLEFFMIWHGLSSFGGFFGAAVGFVVYGRRHRLDLWRSADAICYGLPVGWFFGRMGCTTVHDHPGLLSHHWLAVNYPLNYQVLAADGYTSLHHVLGIFRVNPASAPGAPRFDLGLLELSLTPLLIIAAFVIGARTKKPGTLVATLAIVYPFLRFPLDFLRATDRENGDVRYFGLTPGQYACVAMLLLGLYLWRRAASLPPEPPPSEKKDEPQRKTATANRTGKGAKTAAT